MTDLADQSGAGLPAAIAAFLGGIAATLDPLPLREQGDGSVVWSVKGRPIVCLAGASASFRLGPEIGAAARKTADVAESSRGQDWVAFSPEILDGHARDRFGAWFAAAHRRGQS